jgi:ornithine cyclodeaminase/alanine dehydrogenase-like protein (mu-crystallin family)
MKYSDEKMNRSTKVLSSKDCRKCVDVSQIIDIIEKTYGLSAEGKTIMPPKMIMNMDTQKAHNYLIAGPACIPSLEAIGIKIITGYEQNPQKYSLPYAITTYFLLEYETGFPVAIINGKNITDERTGAMAAVSAKYMANSDSKVITIIGAGVQARSVARYLDYVFKLEEVRVIDINPQAADQFKMEMQSVVKKNIIVYTDTKAAISDSDIIVTVTSAKGKFVLDQWVKPGAFVESIGTYQELDPLLVKNADKIVVDNIKQAQYRGELANGFKDGSLMIDMIHAEIGEVIKKIKVGREGKKERNIAVLTGTGDLDAAVAKHFFDKSSQIGIGTYIDL